jgi:hypothetical protein
MTIGEKHVEALVSELSIIEFENRRLLDDESIRLVAEARSQILLTDDEWTQIKKFLKEALEYLSGPDKTVSDKADGRTVIDPDADPRNADWLRIDAAFRLAHRSLPMWAALWLWRLRTDTSPTFWHKIGRIAEQLGYPEFPSKEPCKCEVVVEVGTEGGSIALIGKRHGRGWTFSCSVNDWTPELINEEPIFHKSAEVASWEAALRLLDKYPWQTLYPSKVHPEFRARVWTALEERLAGDDEKLLQLERWRNLCT